MAPIESSPCLLPPLSFSSKSDILPDSTQPCTKLLAPLFASHLGLAHIYLDRLGLCLFPLRKRNRQQPILVFSDHLVSIHGTRQSERAHETSVSSLDSVVISLL